MRIAYVSADPGVPVYGSKGCSIHVQEVIRALLRRGDEVELHAARLGGDPPPGLENVQVFEQVKLRSGEPRERELAAIAADERLGRVLADRPRFDLVYERHSLWGVAGMDFARQAGIPGILEINAPLIEEQIAHRELVHRAAALRASRRALTAASLRFAVSQTVADRMAPYAEGGPIHVVPNGVDPSRFEQPSDGRPRRSGPFTVGFVGSLKPWHDLSVMVRALALLRTREPECQALVVGDGPQREPMRSELRDLGQLDAVQFAGSVAPAEVPRWLAFMDVGLAPYRGKDDIYFSPLKLFEYMAVGLPVVGSAVGQVAELIEHERTGLLCEPEDPQAMADAIERLRGDTALRTRLGSAAADWVRRFHTWDAVVARVLDLAPESPAEQVAGRSN